MDNGIENMETDQGENDPEPQEPETREKTRN